MRTYLYQDVYDGQWKPVPVPVPLDLVIRSAMLNALAYTDGTQYKAAKLLGVTYRVFMTMMRKHHIPTAALSDKGGRPKRRSPQDLFVPRKPAPSSLSKRTIQ